ncbi:transposase [Sinorhizobium medicae]|uniref:transposase n=1 Tax=Sinorhizobium medicae TaxID=110321 RepID=UPI001F33E3CD|nr:transposase [Sinorhizobium medicae]UWU12312.1 transposase [Sinorhizobium medicae]
MSKPSFGFNIVNHALIRKVRSKHRLRIIEGLLPTERGRKSRPAHDNRQYLNGMLHVLRVGCPWRDMHER